MTVPTLPLGRRLFVVASLAALATVLSASPNDLVWNFINLPETGRVGQTVHCTASVTNTGEETWVVDYHLEVAERERDRPAYVSLATTVPHGTKTAVVGLKLPDVPGTYTYDFAALQHGRGYFGPPVSRTIVVANAPLQVTLSAGDAVIVDGQRTVVRSVAGPEGAIAAHGLEGRRLDGAWETWATWRGAPGAEQVTFLRPDRAGIYELRAFASRAVSEGRVHSERVLLTVAAVAPAIASQPAGAVATVGESIALAVAVSGSEPVYQWQRDGFAVPGATRATLTLAPAQVAQSGSYRVVVSNSAGVVTSRPAVVVINPASLPAIGIDVWHFPGSGGKQPVAPGAARVGDVVSVRSVAGALPPAARRHNVLVRRPGITTKTALPPEDGSGFSSVHEAWNKDGWGSPHDEGSSFDPHVAGVGAADLGHREPFLHTLDAGQTASTRAFDFVLDAPGTWLFRTEVLDGGGQPIAVSPLTAVEVDTPVLGTAPADLTYPYGRSDRFVGVFWNAGQAHRLWSTWRAEHQGAYRDTWAVNWKLMWQPSPYFRRSDGGWLTPAPAADSPWQPFWSAHPVFALVPDPARGSSLTHDLTSRAFAERAALRLMDVGVDFVAVDYTNQFLAEREEVFPAVNNLAEAFQVVARQTPSGQRIKLTAVVPANVGSGEWAGHGGFGPRAIERFNAKLTILHQRMARFPAAWFYLEDDRGVPKPLLLLWVGASGEDEPDGGLAAAKLNQLRLADGRSITEVFTIRWVGAYLPHNRRFLTGGSYTVAGMNGPVTGRYAGAKIWSYHEHFPSAATIMPGANGGSPAVEAITVQPLAAGRDRFDRVWDQNWPAGQGYHYETPRSRDPVPLEHYGRLWREALAAARALHPKFLLTTWAEFGSENDEPRPELSVTIMDNNKFGTHFGDALRQAVRLFKYTAPAAWIDTYTTEEQTQRIADSGSHPAVRLPANGTLRLQGWVTPNVATAFAGGSVKVLVDDVLRGTAVVGGAWNGATRWYFDLPGEPLGLGAHTVKVLAEDGVGVAALAGVQFRGEPPQNSLPIVVTEPRLAPVAAP